MRVFADQGPDAPVIDDFIRAAGVARGTFYNYFTRTDQLLAAVTHALEDELILAIEHEMAALSAPIERLSAGMRLWLRWAQANPQGCSFVVRNHIRGRLVELQLESDLRGGLRTGALRGVSVDVARDVLVGSILGAMSRMLQEPVTEQYCDAVATAILRALGARPRTIDRLMRWPATTLRLPRPGSTAPSSRR